RRGPGVEIIGRAFGSKNRNRMRSKMRVERVADGVGIPVLREIDMGDLGTRMNTGVGPASALHQRLLARHRFDRRRKQALHGRLAGLDLPASKRPAVIFDGEPVAGHLRLCSYPRTREPRTTK